LIFWDVMLDPWRWTSRVAWIVSNQLPTCVV